MSESQKRAQRKYYHKNKEYFHQKNREYCIKYADALKERRQCRARANTHPCRKCGEPVVTPSAEVCHSCSLKGRFAEQSPRWKGGRFTNRGYVYIYKPDHPRANQAGYIQEHRLVWEQLNNRLLPDGWVIHHLNGIKGDNRPANLVALPSRKHNSILTAKAKRIQELEALLNNQGHLL